MNLKTRWMSSAFALLLVAGTAASCGDDSDPKATSDNGGTGGTGGTSEDGGANGGGAQTGTYDENLTLVPILAVDDSDPIAASHRVIVLDADTGEPLDPPLEFMTEAGTGKVAIKGIPKSITPAFHVVGDEGAGTYDTIVLRQTPGSGETLLRISSVGTASLAGTTAGFTANEERAALAGAVYLRKDEGLRTGTVGCAKVFLDDTMGADEDSSQRYSGGSGLPAPLASQPSTTRSGRFYFGNLSTGAHTLKATVDDGKTFLGEVSFVIPRSRKDALGPNELILYQLSFDLDLSENPTPSDCPSE